MSTLGKAVALFCVGYLAWYFPWVVHGLASGTIRFRPLLALHSIGTVAMLVLVLIAVHDLVKRPFHANLKMTWTVVIVFAPFLGPVAYLFLNGFKPREPQAEA